MSEPSSPSTRLRVATWYITVHLQKYVSGIVERKARSRVGSLHSIETDTVSDSEYRAIVHFCMHCKCMAIQLQVTRLTCSVDIVACPHLQYPIR